jgi:hypothetical protein
MYKLAYVVSALVAPSMLTACTSSTIASGPSGAGKMGTEVIRAATTNTDASSVAVEASGVFAGPGTLQLPIGNPRTITFKFARGNLTVLNATGPAAGGRQINKANCAFSQSSDGTYRVLPGRSTGSYAGATGHGAYALSSRGIVPKTTAGACEAGSKAASGGTVFTIMFSGPLLLNDGN